MADSTWKESISLEETNKIRVSLGLKPISSEPSAAKLKEDAAADNFAAHQDEQRQARDQAALQERIDKARNQKERQRKLAGVGLGAEDPSEGGVKGEEGDGGDGGAEARAWVKRQKKRQKEIALAEKRRKEEEEAEKLLQANYGEEDLSGLKVLHGQDDFEEGEETILTLKDGRILDDEDDELHNINMAENAKTAEAVALKKKGKQAGQYTGYDDDEFTDKGKAGVLAKYDDDLTGNDDGGFRLGAPAAPSKAGAKGKGRAKAEDDEPERERVKLSMDYTKAFNNDYLQEGEAGFKIKRKKKRAPARVKDADDALGGGAAEEGGMDVDGAGGEAQGGRIERQNLDETNLIDDDDLQASLARARREQNRKKVATLKANATKAGATSNGMEVDGVKKEDELEELYPSGSRTGGDDDVLVMDDTSEFVRNIQLAAARPAAAATNGVKRNASPVPPPLPSGSASALPPGAQSIQPRIKAEEVDVPISEMTGGLGSPREEGEYDEDAPMGDGYGEPAPEQEDVKPKIDDDELGTAGEKLVSGGLAATLGLLRNQGLIKERTAEELARDRAQKEREAWLAEQRARERQREEERLASRAAGSAISQEQREYENRMREQRDAQIALEAFKDYKPNVEITYHDEFGRNQSLKEAYKQLSHTFHGKGSGTKKTEKRLKKIEEERKQAAMVSGDTPLSSASAFAARAERMGSATMVLSVGNRHTAPVQEEVLNNLKKPDAKGKGKALKGTDKTALPGRAAVIDDIPLRPLPLPEAGEVGRGASPATVRAGFAPVRSFTPIGEGGGDAGEEGGGTRKGFSSGGFVPIAVKRKAEEEPVVEGQTGRVKR